MTKSGDALDSVRLPELWPEKSGVPGIPWPPMLVGVNAAIAALLAQMQQIERQPFADIEAGQLQQLRLLISHLADASAHFGARLKAAGLAPDGIRSLADFRKIAPLTRRDIQAAGDAFYCRHVPKEHHPLGLVKTSGSTGEPVTVRKTAINQFYWLALTVRDHLWNRNDFGGRVFAIRANITKPFEQPDWGAPVNSLYKSGPMRGLSIGTDIREQLKEVADFAPDILIIYPNDLAAFVAIWRTAGFNLKSLKHIKTIGETVSDAVRNGVRETTGLEIEDNYSSQEAGCIAIQCKTPHDNGPGLYHIMSESLIVEVLDENDRQCLDGETGRVVVTDLHNFATPIIRYDIGDYAEVGGACTCGRTLPTLRRILGRKRNLVTRPDGGQHWPLVGFHDFDRVAPVRQYQLVQKTLEDIEFRVVTDEPLSPEQEAGLIAITQKALGYPFNLTIVQSRDRLPVPASGKFEDFISAIDV